MKKLKGVVSNEARTNLTFDGSDPCSDGLTSLNGTTRNETDAHIRKRFGTIEDFLLTSMSSQLDSLSFIKEGSTRRKEILAKFLDLEIFERKFRLSHEDSSDLKGVLKRLGEIDYDNEIALAELKRDEAHKELDKKAATCEQMRQDLIILETNYAKIGDQIASIPAERLDIKSLVEGRRDLEKKIENTNTNIVELKQEIFIYDSQLKEYDDFLTTIDIEDLLEQKKQYDHFKTLYDDTVHRARLMDNEYRVMSKKLELLDDVPCGNKFPSCKFIHDANTASVELPALETEIVDKIQEAREYKSKVVSVDSASMIELIDRYNSVVIQKNNLEIEKRDNKVSIEKLYAKVRIHKINLDTANEKIDLYEDKKELIQNIEMLLKERSQVDSQIAETKSSVIEFEELINQHHRAIGSLEHNVVTIQEKKQEHFDIREEYAAYDLFMRCTHSNGIAYDIIKKRLPVINEEIAKIISNVVDFEVFFQEDGRKLDILIKHPRHEPRPIEMGSGAEKTIAAMGIRLALLSISNLPKGNIFILDEPGTALDAENMEGFIRILQLIKMYFKTVILISHVDSLKDIVDTEIIIDKEKGFARVSQ